MTTGMATALTPNATPSVEIRPSAKQEQFLQSRADIVIFGGGAGGGKSHGLEMWPTPHLRVPGFNATLFRRTRPQLENAGGLWDESLKLYPALGGQPNKTLLRYEFPTALGHAPAAVKLAYCQHEDDRVNFDGAQFCYLGIDQLESFTERIFWYFQSRVRSTCGIPARTRCTANPVPHDHPVGGWLRKLIDYWIDPDSGLFIPERAGKARWFVRIDEQLHWSSDPEVLREQFSDELADDEYPLSLTFIPSLLTDNPILMKIDPRYKSRLRGLKRIDRERLLNGNWNIREAAGEWFQSEWFTIVDPATLPPMIETVRYWDRAATPEDKATSGSSHTAGVLMGKGTDNKLYILDVKRFQKDLGWCTHCDQGHRITRECVRHSRARRHLPRG